jgi:uncharacterized membrane protein YhiD involved in acid resistance
METNIFLALGTATVLGALVGLEREMSEGSKGSVSYDSHF